MLLVLDALQTLCQGGGINGWELNPVDTSLPGEAGPHLNTVLPPGRVEMKNAFLYYSTLSLSGPISKGGASSPVEGSIYMSCDGFVMTCRLLCVLKEVSNSGHD